MVEAGAEEGLLADPSALVVGAGVLGVEDLDGERMAAEAQVRGEVDVGGATAAEERVEAVALVEDMAAKVRAGSTGGWLDIGGSLLDG